MFTSQEFNTSINPFTLRFRRPRTELLFQRSADEYYTRSCGFVCLVLLTATIVVCIDLSVAIYEFHNNKSRGTVGETVAVGIVGFGIVSEFCIVLSGKLRRMRTILFVICTLVGSAIGNSAFESSPDLRPSYSTGRFHHID